MSLAAADAESTVEAVNCFAEEVVPRIQHLVESNNVRSSACSIFIHIPS